MSRLAYRYREAFDRRMPSMIDAWFRASEITASSGPRRVSKTPPFASKQEEYRIVSSCPRNADSLRSSSLWISCVPQMNRTDAMP